MNYVNLTATAITDPKPLSFGDGLGCMIEIATPQYGNYVPTQIELKIWGKKKENLSNVNSGNKIYIESSELHMSYDPEKGQGVWLQGGDVLIVPEHFPNINTVVLAGKAAKDLNEKDSITTNSGFMSVKQRLAVWNKSQKPTFYLFKAIYNVNNKYGVNYVEHVVNFLNKVNKPAIIKGHIVTEAWEDKKTKSSRHQTIVLMADKNGMTLTNNSLEERSASPKKEDTTKLQPVATTEKPQGTEPEWSIAPKGAVEEPKAIAVSEDEPF